MEGRADKDENLIAVHKTAKAPDSIRGFCSLEKDSGF